MRELVQLAATVMEMQRRLATLIIHGPVAQVDAAKKLVRVRIGGTDSEPVLSPWVPYAQIAGALKVHTPPSVGQQMTMLNPTGDTRQAVAMPMTWSDANASPSSSASENVMTFGSVKATLKIDQLLVEIGNATLDMKADKIALGIGASKVVITSDKVVTVKATWLGLDGEGDVLPPKVQTEGGPAKQTHAKV